MNLRKSLIAALCIAAISAPLIAQAGEVRNRETRQENRLYQGVEHGLRINNQRREYLEAATAG